MLGRQRGRHNIIIPGVLTTGLRKEFADLYKPTYDEVRSRLDLWKKKSEDER